MRRLLRDLIAKLPRAAAGLLVLALCTGSHAYAQPSVPIGAGALKSLETGVGAYRDGALEVAVEALSDALHQGDLSETQTAEALYYRGLAYRELGKPGQAISDLTKAMSFKQGLSKALRKEAARNRAGAYSEAGLAESEAAVDTGEQARVRVPVPASRVPVPVEAVDAAEAVLGAPATSFTTTSSIATPAPAMPTWGEASVEVAPAGAE